MISPQNQHPPFSPPPPGLGPEALRLGPARIHSRHRPGTEILPQLDAIPAGRAPLVLLGLGAGFHLPFIREKFPNRRLIVIEPHPAVIAYLKSPDAPSLALNQNEELYGPLDEPAHVLELIERLVPPDSVLVPELLALPAYQSAYSEVFSRVRSMLRSLRDRRSINLATLKRFGKLWLRNTIRNHQLYGSSIPVQQLRDKFAGIPALLLAGGPTLDQILPHLPALSERFLILAVDTALRPTLAAGIEPDFSVLVDPQYWNTRHLDRCRPSRTVFLTEVSANPRSFSAMARKPVLAGSVFPLGESLESGKFERLGAGGSVATTAWDFLRYLGVREIVCAGLDLGFPSLLTHTAGSLSEELRHVRSTRFNPVETQGSAYLHSGMAYWAQDYAGRPLLTDKRMDVYAAWFEAQISSRAGNPPTKILSTESRRIPGIEPTNIEALLSPSEYPLIAQDLRGILEDVLSTETEPADAAEAFEKISRETRDAQSLAEEGLSAIESFGSARISQAELLELLDRTDGELLGRQSRRVLGFLIEEVIQQIRTLPDPSDLGESLERTKMLYQAISDSAHWLLAELAGASST